MNEWKCAESCMGSGESCEIKLVHDNTPDKCLTNGNPVKWTLQNTSSNSEPVKCGLCNGTGWVKNTGGYTGTCDRCGGKGTI